MEEEESAQRHCSGAICHAWGGRGEKRLEGVSGGEREDGWEGEEEGEVVRKVWGKGRGWWSGGGWVRRWRRGRGEVGEKGKVRWGGDGGRGREVRSGEGEEGEEGEEEEGGEAGEGGEGGEGRGRRGGGGRKMRRRRCGGVSWGSVEGAVRRTYFSHLGMRRL